MTKDNREAGMPQHRAELIILELCMNRGAGETIRPSEAARIIAGKTGDWRSVMGTVRGAGKKLSSKGQIEVHEKGQVVDLTTAKGPVRFGLPPR
ncbi:MAG: DUF3253 domain-containing protein [Hyphomicrobiaceae bacterium]